MKVDPEKVVAALLMLGVEGPAVAVDVLRTTGLYPQMYPDQIGAVLNAMTQNMIELQREGEPDDE